MLCQTDKITYYTIISIYIYIYIIVYDNTLLRTLTIIDRALNDINRIRKNNNEELIDIQKIQLNDSFATVDDIQEFIATEQEARDEKEVIIA